MVFNKKVRASVRKYTGSISLTVIGSPICTVRNPRTQNFLGQILRESARGLALSHGTTCQLTPPANRRKQEWETAHDKTRERPFARGVSRDWRCAEGAI